jgi:acyl-CoA dehydrogenase
LGIAESNMLKLLASEATWHVAEATFSAYGGFAFAKEYDIERKWREARLYQTAPISTNLILAYIGSTSSACQGRTEPAAAKRL